MGNSNPQNQRKIAPLTNDSDQHKKNLKAKQQKKSTKKCCGPFRSKGVQVYDGLVDGISNMVFYAN